MVGPQQHPDPTCDPMAASPLAGGPDLPGPAVLGFLACGAVVRREAFLDAGGFDELLFFGGEEALLAIDLEAAGWGLASVEEVVAHHHPGRVGRAGDRHILELRNRLLVDWLRRPAAVAAARTAAALRVAVTDAHQGRAVAGALCRLPAALRHRRKVQPPLERRLRLLESGTVGSPVARIP
ncbi:MAG: glycosyltransferase family 2 protein [Acidimicrobiales bacterium]